MFVFQITAFLILILAIGWRFRIRLVEAVPVACAVLILLLYLLSFAGRLSFSDGIAIAWLLGAVFCLIRAPEERRRDFADYARRELFSAATLTALALTAVVCVCVGSKTVSWWDDYNFWATDVKALFYLDGFAPKYANAASEFGDYPPGLQLMKWWFLHFSPGEFREGLMFAGYYFLNMAFLFPLLKAVKKRNPLIMGAGAVVLWLFPAVAEGFWCDGCCADLTMAVVYGAFLTAVVDRRGKSSFFYYGKQALFLMLLVLCKNTGVIWVAFGLVFDYGWHFLMYRRGTSGGDARQNSLPVWAYRPEGAAQDENLSVPASKAVNAVPGKRKPGLCLVLVTLLPILTEGSWLGFCLMNRRVAKLTGTAIQMATGAMNIPAYQEEMVSAFLEAFVKWPLHRYKTPVIDLSPLGLYLLLLLSVFLLWKFRVLTRKAAGYTGIFLAVTGIVFYSFNLVSHLTIFAVETQYLEPFGMVSSIERYGAPFAIGALYLLAFYATEGARARTGAVICLLFVLLTTDYESAWRALWGYRSGVEEILAERAEIVDEEAEKFLEAAGAGQKGRAGRVLYLRDISDVSWVRNTYVSFEAAPVSVMYGNIDASAAVSQDIANALEEAHGGYLYVGELADGGRELFQTFTEGEEFAYNTLYQVIWESGGVRLVKCTE